MAKRKCAFCDDHGTLTREHLWPVWLHDVLPLKFADSNHTHVTSKPLHFGMPSSVITRTAKRRSGDPGSRKLPIACASCNNGWMSRLQNSSKEFLTPIIQGGWSDLRANAEIVARWCVMTTMVFEYLDPSSIAIPQEERSHLREGKPLSSEWVIWIGQCPHEEINRNADHRAYRFVEGPMTSGEANCQVTTLHVGHMLAQVIFSPFNDHGSNVLYALQNGLKLLHPNPSPTLNEKPPMLIENLASQHQYKLRVFFEEHTVGGIRTMLMPPNMPY